MVSYRANPVQNIQRNFLRMQMLIIQYTPSSTNSETPSVESLPNTLADGIAKRKLIKNIRDMYSAKGTRDGHKLFFRILFDEEAVITYPRDNMLRVSDGKQTTNKVIRVSETGTSDFNKDLSDKG